MTIFEHLHYFKNELVSYTWFIFELIGVGSAPDLREPQALKNVSLQIMIAKTSNFCRKFHKNLHHIHVFDVRYEWQSGSGTLLPLQLPLTQKFAASSASASISLITTSPNAAFYPRKTSKRLKLPRPSPNFCQISIA